MTCSSCGRDSGEGRYCQACSAAQVAICPQGHDNQPGSLYCRECAAPISIQPATPGPGIGCLARLLAWATTLGLLAVVGHLLHHATTTTVLAVFGIFGITQVDLYNATTIFLVVPSVIAIVSFMLPGAMGPAVRRGLWWALQQASRLLWIGAKGIGHAVWHLAEGSREPERSARKPKRVDTSHLHD